MDPICGNCGNPLSSHYRESHPREGERIYCNLITNGDVFTTEPQDQVIFDAFIDQHPDLYDKLVTDWKRANGHLPN